MTMLPEDFATQEAFTDTLPVTFEVLEVERIERGTILAAACVRVEIQGVEVLVQGVTMRRDGQNRANINPPQFRDPRTGNWYPAVVLPQELWDAIALEIGARVTGQRTELVEV